MFLTLQCTPCFLEMIKNCGCITKKMYYFKTFAEETLNSLNNCVESAKVRFVVMMKDGTT